jgi:hypothetical protein
LIGARDVQVRSINRDTVEAHPHAEEVQSHRQASGGEA